MTRRYLLWSNDNHRTQSFSHLDGKGFLCHHPSIKQQESHMRAISNGNSFDRLRTNVLLPSTNNAMLNNKLWWFEDQLKFTSIGTCGTIRVRKEISIGKNESFRVVSEEGQPYHSSLLANKQRLNKGDENEGFLINIRNSLGYRCLTVKSDDGEKIEVFYERQNKVEDGESVIPLGTVRRSQDGEHVYTLQGHRWSDEHLTGGRDQALFKISEAPVSYHADPKVKNTSYHRKFLIHRLTSQSTMGEVVGQIDCYKKRKLPAFGRTGRRRNYECTLQLLQEEDEDSNSLPLHYKSLILGGLFLIMHRLSFRLE